METFRCVKNEWEIGKLRLQAEKIGIKFALNPKIIRNLFELLSNECVFLLFDFNQFPCWWFDEMKIRVKHSSRFFVDVDVDDLCDVRC